MFYQKSKQFISFSENLPSYTAYPTKKKKIDENSDTISIDTLEKKLRLLDRKTINNSVNSELLS